MLPVYVPGRGAVDSFADDVGMPHNAVRLVVGLVLGCVLAPLSHVVVAPTSRHALNTLLGVSIGWFVFDFNLVHSLVPTLLTYGLMSFAPRELVGPVASAILFMHLIACHAYRELLGADIIWDGAQMVLTLKLAGTAISYSDAVLPLNQKTPSILRNQVTAKPSLLSVLGYVYFFPTFLVGPIFELNDYLAWTDDAQVAPVAVILPKLGTLIVCIAGHAASEVLFPIMTMDAPPYYASYAFPARFVLQLAATMFYKFRFVRFILIFLQLFTLLIWYEFSDPVQSRIAPILVNLKMHVADWLHYFSFDFVLSADSGKPMKNFAASIVNGFSNRAELGILWYIQKIFFI
ncbi:hypothetical protein, variant 6 [Aphanomyces astaci]|uniref:Uncharacterized protein n=1 Tax=Aphanomyces astaci TaxID=112090 RepID=W4FN35_APHAT|nr:hypothetical protein, variant 9 [Aphanomyces astaci]XP_009842323.1 hypothetical protein, variant 10 [Aphanomyces astaci]XP_009842327.1 hypothetical protein, variant 3 [Aphanomyces astaci]XP_009842328.1 hypothetical protein, variant 4 [Aphanomyces astaci]XP_009842329.1 hypothetical protein, variant 5 [Aphanomyces astaci]XP_009842330.1 hypothetical protein, variant 7 [Aphanomyces astaci]XP_009842331.1 hypothetical protein, variant 8 [Aphanomyces astaci]XP_009842332.1 hypothetical protein, v|eukprot:XP_009842322.1 hypothetical protein, variant 9 [Aphanomyces astaci]